MLEPCTFPGLVYSCLSVLKCSDLFLGIENAMPMVCLKPLSECLVPG